MGQWLIATLVVIRCKSGGGSQRATLAAAAHSNADGCGKCFSAMTKLMRWQFVASRIAGTRQSWRNVCVATPVLLQQLYAENGA